MGNGYALRLASIKRGRGHYKYLTNDYDLTD